jgi:hypothetical protein
MAKAYDSSSDSEMELENEQNLFYNSDGIQHIQPYSGEPEVRIHIFACKTMYVHIYVYKYICLFISLTFLVKNAYIYMTSARNSIVILYTQNNKLF